MSENTEPQITRIPPPLHATGRARVAHDLGPAALALACAIVATGQVGAIAQTSQSANNPNISQSDPSTLFTITKVEIVYLYPSPGQPSVESLLRATIRVKRTADGYEPAAEGENAGRVLALSDVGTLPYPNFTGRALQLFSVGVATSLKQAGLVGVYVAPDPGQFGVEQGVVVDRRAPGDTSLRLLVTTGTVTKMRTVALGERIEPEKTIDNPLHARIIEQSPVRPSPDATPTEASLLRGDRVGDYVYRLNRQPGRRVDISVSAPGDSPGAVTLDYLVTENRPWLFFAQASNTGSASTDAVREQFGFIHNQLTNSDDVLSLTYQTANFSAVHALNASYERPVGSSQRWRWRVYAGWYRYLASDVGVQDASFRGEGYDAGAELIWNFLQHHDWFVDAIAGLRYDHVRVSNELAGVSGGDGFFTPEAALRLFRERDDTRTDARLGVRWNLPGIAGTDGNLDALGRLGADDSFGVLRFEGTHSLYLDPLFSPETYHVSSLAHELLFSLRAQHSLGTRLIPNEQVTAGGLYTVRGYPESIVAGDNGVIATAEYRFHLPRSFRPKAEPGTVFGQPFRWQPQYVFGPTDWDLVLKGFVDVARVTQADRQSYEADSTLVGAGVGAEFAFTRRFNIRTDLGFALRELRDGSGEQTVDAGHTELQFVLTVIY